LHRALREVRPPVDPHLDPRALVDQQRDPLARGQLLALVLSGDLLGAAAEHDLLAPRAQILGERAQQAGGWSVGAQSQRPFHSGSRFSKNALTPSWMSSVENAIVSCERRKSIASANAMSCWRNIASLPSFIRTGDLLASFSAHSTTADSNSSATTTRLTIPIRWASSAEICSPSKSSSLVFLRPTLR